ncbi:MAG: hypothetical protein CL600_11220 [Alteromonas sp.]|jgi:hypothetical protein|uniref:hypothetical protein n=1 Tax=Alteromonas sp. RW2A1 TaxID=1917158 RepID=UPI000903BF28|nr:hypothetical protein [Alteromonas sp. RW2A1]APE07398.1 hypothetical protein BM528_17790 [Alteromonas sp. RW2A1]MAI65428.1 hypothetical protein [Alteromonas sp.]
MSHSASSALSHNARKDRKKKATNNSDNVDTSAIVEPADANKSNNAFDDKKNIMWVLLSGAMALTFIVMLFLPNTGMGDGMIATYSSMLWCGFFGAALWRYCSANGWTGFAIGSVVGFILQVISQII